MHASGPALDPRGAADPHLAPTGGAAARVSSDGLLAVLRGLAVEAGEPNPLRHIEHVPARPAVTVTWPDWTPLPVSAAFLATGVGRPWRHQIEAAQAAWRGDSVVLATGTSSGKSLAYQLPGLSALVADDRARVMYLSPAKALAGDQLRSLTALSVPGVRPSCYDGDTPPDERDWVRAHANWILTNPDMLSRGILPAHERWSSALRRLRFVVVDEAHAYRGLFGAHTANVLRRLRRICALYGAAPVFVLTSATVADPEAAGHRLTGLPVRAITDDTSPRGRRSVVLWEPSLVSRRPAPDASPGTRRVAGAEAAAILARFAGVGARTLAFVRSRRGAEITALGAARELQQTGRSDVAERIVAYRGGYLSEHRRAVERALKEGRLLGVAATNALELGIDVTGLDAVVVAGFPGTLASFWQQAGRAGRSGSDAVVVFIARDDPLDTYLVHHPDALFGRPVEAARFDPTNPAVLAGQLCAAAAERALTPADLATFGGAAAEAVLDDLVRHGALRRRPSGWFWTERTPPRVDLRSGGGDPVTIVQTSTGRLIGTVDAGAAHAAVHDGAVYLHGGQTWVVERLDLDRRCALVRDEHPDWTTSAQEVSDLAVVATTGSRQYGPVGVHTGVVDVSSQVISYQRRRVSSGEIIDLTPLDLPERRLRTRAVWYTIEADELQEHGIAEADMAGSLHAAEHAAIGLLPLFAVCDRWDIGGISTARHPDTGAPTVFVYDGYPGGAGFAERGHEVLGPWLRATRDAVAGCPCTDGCPACVQSPKCGNGNWPLDKDGAVRVLDVVLDRLPDRPGGDGLRRR